MKAYAVLDGGGVKGAALAGCLKAAAELGVEFEGYAGTSAGAIVALLAAVGYTGQELHHIMVHQVDFLSFLDDRGTRLNDLKEVLSNLSCGSVLRNRATLKSVKSDFGVYKGDAIQQFLLEKIRPKLTGLARNPDPTFDELRQAGCPPLRIVAADVRLGEEIVFSDSASGYTNGSVISAVRASMSYPFVFQPVRLNTRYLVDGGLTTNLPIHVFEGDRKTTGYPIVAFDLISPARGFPTSTYTFSSFIWDMLDTALGAADRFTQEHLHDVVYRVPVETPAHITAMSFELSEADKERLFLTGHSSTHTFFSNVLPHWAQAQNEVELLQARYAEPTIVNYVLEAAARDFERRTGVGNIRAHVMVPTGHGTRRVIYQFGMDADPDVDLELNLDGGCSGRAWVTKKPVFADLQAAKQDFQSWNMTREQQNKVRQDRQTMLSVPIFRQVQAETGQVAEQDVMGVFSVDTSSSIRETQWTQGQTALRMAQRWADILSPILE